MAELIQLKFEIYTYLLMIFHMKPKTLILKNRTELL